MVNDERGLARFIDTPTGLTAKEARNFAGLRLELMREKSLAEIDDSLDGLGGYLRLLKGAPPPAVAQEMHRLSYSILELAGTFGYEALGKAAHSLCALLDDLGTRREWNRVYVDIHFDALRVLRNPETISPSMQAHLLEGLRKVVDRSDADAVK